jgi:hypothetical protein
LDSQKAQLDEQVLRLSEFQQSILLRAMDSALGFAKKQLKEQYPDVDSDRLDALVGEGLLLAKHELMAEDD